MLQFALSIRCLVLTVSRWQSVVTLGRPLFISNIVSWHLCLIKASCITWPAMISTMLIISSQTVVFPHFSNSTQRATLNNKQDNPELLKFKPKHYMKNGKLNRSVRDLMDIAFGFGRRWALFILSIGPCLIVWCHHCSGRIYPGKHDVHSIVTLTAVSILSILTC